MNSKLHLRTPIERMVHNIKFEYFPTTTKIYSALSYKEVDAIFVAVMFEIDKWTQPNS